MSVNLNDLASPPMTLAEVEAMRRGKWLGKGKSRLEIKEAAKPLVVVDDKAFKAIVRKRDKLRCRMCGCKVVVQLQKTAKRAEVHHVHGRRGDFRFDDRFALLVCCEDHEKLTGKVNTKYIVVGTVFIEIAGQQCIDAREPVTFEKVA